MQNSRGCEKRGVLVFGFGRRTTVSPFRKDDVGFGSAVTSPYNLFSRYRSSRNFGRFSSIDSVLDESQVLPYFFPMSKAAKAGEAVQNLPFEEALKRLEAIVEAMESQDLPLESLLARFEEGTQLAKVCQAKLADAEVKIQKLEKNSAGEAVLKPLDPDLSEEEP